MCSACATMRPSASNRAHEQSRRSLMFDERLLLDQHDAHLLGDADERADEDRQRHRVGGVRPAHVRSRTSAPAASSVDVQPGPDDAGRLREARRPRARRTLSPGASVLDREDLGLAPLAVEVRRPRARAPRLRSAGGAGEGRLRRRRRCRRPGSRRARPACPAARSRSGAWCAARKVSGDRRRARPTGIVSSNDWPSNRASAKRRSVAGAGRSASARRSSAANAASSRRWRRSELAEERRDVVAAQVGDGEPERAQHAARAREQDPADPKLLGEAAGVHAARSAERDDRQVARIDAPLDADHAQRADHLGFGDRDDPGGRVDRVERQLRPRARCSARSASSRLSTTSPPSVWPSRR